MNWSKAKTILIIFFLFVDIFLAANVFPGNTAKIANEETVNSTVEVLKDRGIIISPETAVQKKKNYKYIEANNAIESYDEFAKKTVGNAAKCTDGNSYEGGGGKISFNGDAFVFIPRETAENGGIGTASEAQSIAKKALTNLLPSLEKAEISSEIIPDGYRVTFTNNADGMTFFNSRVSVDVCMKKVKTVSGSWFYKTEATGKDNSVKSITSALIECIPLLSSDKNTEITSIDLGYTLFEENTYHKSAVLIPVWQMTAADGRQIYIDARSTE